MSKTGITKIRIEPGQSAPSGNTDWKRLRAMSDAEIEAAARADPDAPPLTPERLARMRRAADADVKALRERLGLTQEQFARAYRLPIGTVRDWEQGRTRPDAPALALLAVIAHLPDAARAALG